MRDILKSDRRKITFVEQVLQIFSVILTVVALIWVLWFCRNGIDFTDESFYLIWMANPFDYSVSTTQFGFIYHPLYEILNGNIAALRQVNILLTFFLAFIFCDAFQLAVCGKNNLESKTRLIISCGLAITSLAFLRTWIPTPNYNTLTLQGLFLVGIGLLWADKKLSKVSIGAAILIGLGGWLTFMAKPTSAMALCLCCLLYLVMSGKFDIRFVLISLVATLIFFLIGALYIDGSIPVFIHRLKAGAEVAKIRKGGKAFTEILRVDHIHLVWRARLNLFIATAGISLIAFVSSLKNQFIVRGNTIISIVLALTFVGAGLQVDQQTLNADRFQGLLLAIPFSAIVIICLFSQYKGFIQLTRTQLVTGFCFAVFPYIYAVGTDNNYWAVGSNAAIFCILAGVSLLYSITKSVSFKQVMLHLGIAAQVITITLINIGLDAPYRQSQSLRKDGTELSIGGPGSSLILSKDFAQYIIDARNAAKQAQFSAGTPMIDLSGRSPGILYALDAQNIGQAWTLGGYPGSDKSAIDSLRRVPCETLALAWLLVEPDGYRKLSSEILLSYGANITTDFHLVGSFEIPKGAGGYAQTGEQQILKPLRPQKTATNACLEARKVSK